MYRIEVATGEETVFRTIEELATGIRNGLITPRSRIHHAASQKWLPIEFHPHYKKALELVTGGAPMIDTGPTRPAPTTRRSPPPPSESPRAAAAPPPPPRPDAWGHAAAERLPPDVPRMTRAPLEAHPPVGQQRVETRPAETHPIEAPTAETPAVATLELERPAGDLVLPKISYPELAPPPAESMPVARRRRGGPGPLVAGGILAVALIGGYFATISAAPSITPEAIAAPPAADHADPAAQEEVVTPTPVTPPSVAREMAPRPPGPVSQAWSSSAGAIAPVPAPARPAPVLASEPPSLAPAPAALDLSLSQLPPQDSIVVVPGLQRDSTAIKRILRAVGGPPAGAKPER